jgi:hypothetical protein
METLANYWFNRFFKTAVYNTNHANIEKALLGRENLQQTVRILLNNGMRNTDAEMSDLLQYIHSQCPTLFESVLPRSEQESLRNQLESLVEDDEVPLISTARHRNPAAIGCISTAFARRSLRLPVKSSDLDEDFKFSEMLRKAYSSEYKLKNVYEFGKKWLLWVKKLAFTDRYVRDILIDFPRSASKCHSKPLQATTAALPEVTCSVKCDFRSGVQLLSLDSHWYIA